MLKRIAILIITSFIFSCQSVTPVLKNGIYTKNNKPYSGKYVEKYADGNIKYKGRIRDGRPHSKWTWYYENGNTKTVGKYDLGKKNGTWIWFRENGFKMKIEEYDSDKKSGYWIEYYPDGKQRLLIKHFPEENIRIHYKWFKNGSREYEQHYHKENDLFTLDGASTEWYMNGRPRFEGNYEGGILNGFQKWFYDNGNLMISGYVQQDQYIGVWTRYNNKGTIIEERDNPPVSWVYEWIPLSSN